jgi:CheY-like chemotaxis protein
MQTILLEDDDRNILIAWKRILQLEGYRVATASDGEAGLAAANEVQPVPVITDRSMPGTGGIEFCLQLRREPKLAGIPVVLVSADHQIALDPFRMNFGKSRCLSRLCSRRYGASSDCRHSRSMRAELADRTCFETSSYHATTDQMTLADQCWKTAVEMPNSHTRPTRCQSAFSTADARGQWNRNISILNIAVMSLASRTDAPPVKPHF